MKQKLTTKVLVLAALLLTCSLFLWNCEKEASFLESFASDPQYRIRKVSVSELPKIQNFLKSTISKKSTGRSNTTETPVFNEQDVLVSEDSLENVSYTLRFTYPSTPLGDFYNLNIKETPQGDFIEASVVEFVSDQQYVAVFVENNFDFHYFTGSMSLHPFENFFSSDELPFSRTTDCYDGNGDPLSCNTSDVTDGGNDGANGTGADPGEGNDPGGDTTTSGTGGGITYGGGSGSCTYTGIYVTGCGGSNSDRLHAIGTCGGNLAIASRFAVWDCGGGATTRTTDTCANCPDNTEEVLINDEADEDKDREDCEELNEQVTNSDFLEKMQVLEDTLNEPHETGYAQEYTGEYNAMELADDGYSLKFPTSPTVKGMVHNHAGPVIKTNLNTGEEEEYWPTNMYSPTDIESFLQTVSNGDGTNFDVSDAYSALVTFEGNYILKFKGDITNIPNPPDPNNERVKNRYEIFVTNADDKVFGLLFFLNIYGVRNVAIYEINDLGAQTGKYIDENGDYKIIECF